MTPCDACAKLLESHYAVVLNMYGLRRSVHIFNDLIKVKLLRQE